MLARAANRRDAGTALIFARREPLQASLFVGKTVVIKAKSERTTRFDAQSLSRLENDNRVLTFPGVYSLNFGIRIFFIPAVFYIDKKWPEWH